MKKIVSIGIAFLLLLSFMSCNTVKTENPKDGELTENSPIVLPQYEYAEKDSSLNLHTENISVSPVYDIDSSDLAASDGGGNSWGGYMGRGVRMSDGTLYSYVTFHAETVVNPELDKVIYIYKFDGKKWSRVSGPFAAGRDPVSMLKDPSKDKFYIVAWPEKLPTIMAFTPKNITKPEIFVSPTANPENTGYNSAGISPDGVIWALYSQGAKEWEEKYICHSTFNTKDNTWTAVKKIEITARHCYYFIIPEENGVMSFSGIEDLTWKAKGMKKPSKDVFDYVFPALRIWRTEDLGDTFKVFTVHDEPQTEEYLYMNVGNNYSGDYIKGKDGKYNVIYTVTGASVKGETALFHAIYDKNGQLELKRLPFGDAAKGGPAVYSRMAYDKDGRGYYISYSASSSKIKVYAVDTENGIKYSDPAEFDLGEGNEVVYSGLWPVSARIGNSDENYIDFTYPSGQDGKNIKYFRINLN